MLKRVQLREVGAAEAGAVRRLACSQSEAAAVVQRARVIWALLEEPGLSATAAGRRAGFRRKDAGPMWVQRFNARGVAGLCDRARAGRPTPALEVKSRLIALALQQPRSLGHPFTRWTLERLQRVFQARTGVRLSDRTIWTWLKEEGLIWKRQQSWLYEPQRHGPDDAGLRWPSSGRTRPRPHAAGGSASTSSDPSP